VSFHPFVIDLCTTLTGREFRRNEVWEPWIGPKNGPTRATIQANLMNPGWLIEVVIVAACCKDYPEEEEEDAKDDKKHE